MFEIGFFSIAALAVVFAGISKGGFGSGAAFAAAAILATIIEPGQAIGIMLPLLMLMDVTSLKPYWKKWLNRESVILILGSLPGVALGAWLYSRTNADVFRILIGVIALGFVLWQLGQRAGVLKQAKHHMPDWAGLIAGRWLDLQVLLVMRAVPLRQYICCPSDPIRPNFRQQP